MALADTQDTAGPWSDYTAPDRAGADDGPWGDYETAKQSTTPAATSDDNHPAIDYSHPAGITGQVPALPAHPQQLPLALDPNLEDKASTAVGTQFSNVGKSTRDDLVGGAQDVYGAAKQDFEHSHGNPFAAPLQGDEAKQNRDKALGGAAKLIAGGGTLMVGAEAPAVMEVASRAIAGDVAAKFAIAKIAASVGVGAGASAAGGAVADKYDVSPGAKNLIQAVAFFVPSLLGIAAGVKSGAAIDAEGNPVAVGSAFGGKVKAGATVTPEAYDIRAKVGDTRVGVKIPRAQAAPPPPDPASVLNAEQSDAGTNAIVRAATKAQQAAQVVAGGPPPPPPGPPMPDGMTNGVISQQVVHDIAAAIHIAPPEQHPQLLMEAHGKLTDYIQKQGRIIGPDGKLQIAETPQQAAKLAQNIINDEVDRQSQAKADSEKAQADALKEQQKAATTPAEDGGLSPADMQWQRAKTLIESTTLKPGQTMAGVLQRSLRVGPQVADEMVQRHAKETAEAAIPTVGSKKEPVVEESRATVDAQLEALKRGDTKVVMLPKGSRYMPKLPDGMKMMSVDGDAPGAGKYIYDPKQIKAATIKIAAKAGTHGDLLGHIQPKEELAASPDKPTVVVQAKNAEGTVIQDSEVHPELVHEQAEAMHERHPDAHISVAPTHEVIADRLSEQEPEGKGTGGDIFDQVAEPKEVAPKEETEKGELSEKIPEQSAGEVRGVTEPTPAPKYENGRNSNISTMNRESGAGDKSTQTPQETPAGAELHKFSGDIQLTSGGDIRVGKDLRWAIFDRDGSLLRQGLDDITKPSAEMLAEFHGVASHAARSLKSEDRVRVVRYSSAKTWGQITKEVNNPKSRDHGTGQNFNGLVAALHPDEEFRPFGIRLSDPKFDDQSAASGDHLEAYINSQEAGKGRRIWEFTVPKKDITGYATRSYENGKVLADGITIRPGADAKQLSDQSPSPAKGGDVRKIVEASKPEKPATAAPIAKGSTVSFTDRDGKSLEGIVAHAGDRMVRIKSGAKEYTVTRNRVKPVAESPAKVENKPDESGDAQAGGRRETADTGSGDRAPLAERPSEVLPTPQEREPTAIAGASDSPDVRDRIAAVPVKGSGSGPGQGSDTGIDSAPGIVEIEKATKALAKVVKLNQNWFSHPSDFSVPTGEMGKLDANIKAISILRDVEKNPRTLSAEEKADLARYAGWGALSNVFNPYRIRDHQQQMRYREAARTLSTLLSPDELAAAERSTMNAHYTSPEVVRWMWDIAKRLGFNGGTVLEPSMGSGNFFGMMPKSIRAAVSAIGNELDPITYGIAKQLYPDAQLYNKDFVDLIMADNSVDFAIGNVPFGVKIHDPKYPKLKAQIHDYFFIKSLDKVRPGGIVSFITSTGSMDKIDTNIRDLLASRADLVAAFRLPSTAFKAVAGTEVTTDLMIFRKRAPGQPYKGEPFVQSVEMKLPNREKEIVPLRVSEYYAKHPDNMLGVPTAASTMYGRDNSFALEPHPDKNMKDLLDQALRRVPVGDMDVSSLGSKQADTAAAFAPDNVQEGQYVVEKGKLLQRSQGRLIAPPVLVDKFGVPSLRKAERIKGMVGLRDKLNGLLTEMKVSPNSPDANSNIQAMADALRKDYDAFVAKNGLINAAANNVFEDDPHYPRLLALENYDRATKKSVPADIFTKRTIFPREALSDISPDPEEALQQILGESGFPDVALIAQLQGKPKDEVAKALIDKGLVFQDPLSGKYETPTSYLSGYVRDKLADAQAAVDQGLKQYERNVEALTKALPPTIPVKEINIRLGQTWIPTKAIESFIQDVMNTNGKVTNVAGIWKVEVGRSTAETTALYGIPKRSANELMEDSLNQRQTSINYPPDTDGKTVLDVDATNAARAMQAKIAQAFTNYAVEHKVYGPQFEQLYNYAYNNLVRAEYDGSHLKFPGMVKEMQGKPFALQAHQINLVWQFLQEGRGFAAHTVGAGKTFATVASVMESRRLGLGKKHMVSVPNHLVQQWRREWMELYPGATLLVPTKDDFNAKNRNKIMAKIATGDFDAVILPHSQFNLMDISPERQEKTMQGEMNELNETIRALEQSEGKKSRTVKQMAKARESLRTKMAKLKDLKADKTINFDELGVDRLYVDEAHEYKNLSFYTKMQRVSGLGQSASKKGTRLLMKTQYLQDTQNGRGVHFLSGTPVQNTMAELYTQNKYVAPDVLEKAGIRFFDDWAANFGEAITNMELSADGRSYKARTKFAQFVNVPELMQMFRSFTDVKMKDDLNLPTPKVKNGGQTVITVPASDAVDEYVKGLMERALNVSGKGEGPKPDPTEDNMLKITSDGRKAATDMRLISPSYPDDPDSKINQAVEEIFRTHRETREQRSTQAVFLDMYRAFEGGGAPVELSPGVTVTKKPRVRLNLYEDMRDKLIAKGVPASEIAIVTEAKTKEDKQRIFDRMNSGQIRVLLGSTQKMGAGMNAQRKMIRLHNLDLPWRPGDLEQRIGRIERQGNENEEVEVSNYLTTKSFDAYMAQTLQTKASFIHQVIGGKYKGRTMIDAAGPQVMAMEEMKIAASGDPNVKRKFELERTLNQLQSLERSYESSRFNTMMRISEATSSVARLNGRLAAVDAAAAKYAEAVGKDGEGFHLDVDGKKFTARETAFEYLKAMDLPPGNFYLTMQGQGISVTRTMDRNDKDVLKYNLPYTGGQEYDAPKATMESLGRSIESRLRQLPDEPAEIRETMAVSQARAEKMKKFAEEGKFDQAGELAEVTKELARVNAELGIGNTLDGKLALTDGVTAEADNSGETEDEAEAAEDSGDSDLEKSDDEDAPAKRPGTTMRSSLFGMDLLAEFMGGQGKKLWEKEIAPHIPTAIDTFRKATEQTAALLYPRIGANDDALDSMFRTKGEREKARFMLERMEGGLEKFFDQMPEEARLAFIDRYKLGVGQLDPKLQKIEGLMRAIDKESFDRAKNYKPSMTAKDDHYRVLWKVIPDKNGTHAAAAAGKGGVGPGRRPFEGDKGFMKRSTLDTISEGIAYGGVPISTNPWKMFTLAQQSIMQYITAQDHWADLKSLGLRKFVKPGTPRPEGWVKLDDHIAKAFFPASSGEGMIQAGEWYLEPSAGRILNNYLSRDLLRENAIGNVLMVAKNLSTAIELGMSPFHFGFETMEAIGSQFGVGVLRLWNNGIRLGQGAEAMKGLKEMATSIAAPVLTARSGGSLLKMVDNPSSFAQTKRGAAFLKAHPDAADVLDELFTGGYQWGMNPDYKFDPVKSMQQALTDKNYGGAMLRLIPWVNHVIMTPLFEHYIPRLKLGFALAQYTQQLAENGAALANGDTSRAKIARRVIDTAENRFGEMNFSNIMWNNTFKSVAQFLFRSVTWKLGNWRGLVTAAGPETYSAFKDPIQAMVDDAKAGTKRPKGEYIPKLGMNQAWLVGMMAATAVLGTVLTKIWTGEYPWELAMEDKEMSIGGALLLEMSHPRTGQLNAKTGKPERISLPTGFKDFEHAYLHPREYARGSLSGTAGNFIDLLENRDFFGNYVYDPNAPLYQQVAEAVKYGIPKPIAGTALTDKHGGQDFKTKALKFSGLSPTSRERDLSPAEQRMQEIRRRRVPPLTPEQVQDREDEDAIVKKPTVRSMHMALRRGHQEYVEKEFNNMSYADAREVYNNLATPAERRLLKPMMDKKRMSLLHRNPDAVRRADAK